MSVAQFECSCDRPLTLPLHQALRKQASEGLIE